MTTAGKNWVVDRLQELQVRLARIRTPSSSIPVVPSAAIRSKALNILEQGMHQSATKLSSRASRLLADAQRIKPGAQQALESVNKQLALLQLRADSLFTTFDLLQDATSIRADVHTGSMLKGVDVLLEHCLRRPIPGYTPPLAVSYLDSSGRGGAIARARTKLPGGYVLGVGLVRVSPESIPMRLSSVLHEAGHQLSVDLQLLDEAKKKIHNAVFGVSKSKDVAKLYSSWASELMADCWSIVLCGGVPAVDGLQRVLSLPEQLLYIIRPNAPHPPGPIRVAFADSSSRLMFDDPALDVLGRRFSQIYGTPTVSPARLAQFRQLLAASPAAARALMTEPFRGLGGRSMIECGERWLVHPVRIRKLLRRSKSEGFQNLERYPPLQVMAMLGFCRILKITPLERLNQISSEWLTGLAGRNFRGIANFSEEGNTPNFRLPNMRTT